MKHMYAQFPQKPEFEQKYNFKADFPYILKTMAGINEKSGTFITDSPDLKGRPIKAKRSISVEIADRKVDFYPLNKETVEQVIQDVDREGTVDFRVNLKYSLLDEKYDRVPFKGDSYLVRTNLENGVLTMKVHHIDGMGRTKSSRIADTIVDEIVRNAPDV